MEEAAAFVFSERFDPSSRVDARVPENLIRDDVAHAGHERLVHQSCLHASATSPEQVEEFPATDG
jgi:hypothetical protein